MNSKELENVLANHKIWIDTDGKEGDRADLSGADLSGADLREANLREANLWVSDLSGANLREANLSGANLWGANLWGVNLWGANLSGADLSGSKGVLMFNKINGRTCYAVVHQACFMIKAGCFWGTLDEFEESCKETYPDNPIEAYAPQIAYLRQIWQSA